MTRSLLIAERGLIGGKGDEGDGEREGDEEVKEGREEKAEG